MKRYGSSCMVWALALSALLFGATEKHRLLILADMGNEPDEMQQMVHMIMCSNEFDIEGLVAVTGKYLQPASRDPYKQVVHPELFHEIIDAYAEVLPNLMLHADGWHDPDDLRSLVAAGQPGYGIEGTGEGKSSPGSELIIQAVTRDDPRPIWLVVNAGSNTLAQAIKDYQRFSTSKEMGAFITRLRVFENGAQDNAGAWICHNFPDIHWIRSNYQTYCYGGPSIDGVADNLGSAKTLGPYTWEPYAYSNLGQHQWALEHIKGHHGPLGRVWPIRQFHRGGISFLEGGGTIPWLGLINRGLFSIDHPHWGGWSGRFTREKVENYWSKHTSVNQDENAYAPFYVYADTDTDHWINPDNGDEYNDHFTPVWRWRRAFFNNFMCRMDWCVKPYDEANHHPNAVVDGDAEDTIRFRKVEAGQTLTFDGSGSTDPDGDALDISWWIYREAGTYPGEVALEKPAPGMVSVTIPKDAAGKEIHLILEVKDLNEIASLYDYRRIVLQVKSS